MLSIKESIIVNRNNDSLDRGLSRISKFRAELMGLSIIWIMMLHGAELYSTISVPVITMLANRGNLGVDIFLFLSGFGLFFSMEKNSDIGAFYKRRIQRVLVPYLLLAIPFWGYNTVFHSYSIQRFFEDLMGISFVTNNVVTTWYVFLILFLYLLYPLLFTIERKKTWMADLVSIISVFIFTFLILVLSPNIYNNIEIAITRIPGFVLGSLAARITSKNEKSDKVLFCLYTVFSVFAFVLSVLIHEKNHFLSIMLYRFGGVGIAVVLLFLISAVLPLFRGTNVLKHLGTISLELYLLHIFMRAIMRNHGIGLEGSSFCCSLIWTLVVAFSVLLSTLFNNGYSYVRRNWK